MKPPRLSDPSAPSAERPERANSFSVRSKEPRHPIVAPASRLGQTPRVIRPSDRRTPMLCRC